MGVICLTIFTLILWQLLSAIHRFHLIISSPVEVLQRAYGLVIRGESIPPIETTIWYHFGISLAELLGGLVSSVTAAVLLTQGLSAASKWRRSH
jgi:ABC-type nitrate/sulfonate/bicarbonate transport system permease component